MTDSIRMTWPEYRRGECLWHGRHVRLGQAQLEVLSTLLMRRGCPVAVGELIEAIYPDPDLEPESAEEVVRNAIRILRVKFGGLIRSSHGRSGFGWTIDLPAEPLRAAA